MRMVVDTCVWSLFFRRRPSQLSSSERAIVFLVRDMIIEGRAVLLGLVRQELLTGVSEPIAFRTIRDRLHGLDDTPPDVDDYEHAAIFANRCAANGIAGTTVDMLICGYAAGRDLPILTTDLDFLRYAKFLPIRLHVGTA